MKRTLFVFMSLAVIASMLLGACSSATTPAPTAQPTDAPVVNEPAQPTADTSAGGSAPEPTQAPEPTAEPTEAPKSDRLGGWLDKIIFSTIAEIGPAVEQLNANAIDMYLPSSEDAEVFEKVKASPDLKYANSYGGENQLLFNTAVCADASILNPFTDMKIREAMNWAVDRKYIAEDLMGGLAVPKFTPFTSAFADYSRYSDMFSAIETKYAYDLQKAKDVVDAEMPKLGATKGTDGKWQFNGKPVTIIGLIRTEDARKEIGNYFAAQLESLGFSVNRQEKTSKEASPIWAQGEPTECAFNYYTAGWGAQVVARDDGNMFTQYNTGQQQSMPVFEAFKPSAELLDVATKLYTSQFSTMDERADLFAKALPLAMEESLWGVWVTDNISYSPYRAETEGAYDLASGFASAQLFPYTARISGKEGGELRLAVSDLLIDPWNPLNGSNWQDDASIQHFAEDYGLVYNPYTGLITPKLVEKAELVAETGLPITKSSEWIDLSFQDQVEVPGDAWVDWDAKNQKFITASEKFTDTITAKVKSVVVYNDKLWDTTWHDGSKLSPADFVMNMILTFDLGKQDSPVYDESMKDSVETFLTHFKGVRIVSTDPLTIETYDDQYTMDAENSLYSWYPSQYIPTTGTLGMMAWHDLTPGLLAEENQEMAFSSYKATALKKEQTSLISGPTLDIQMKYLDQAAADKYIPYAPTLGQYVTADEAAARYANLKQFFAAHKHLFIGTGPYFVDQVFPVEKSITLSRYEAYLFPADQWSSFAEPHIPSAVVEGPLTVKAGEEASFDVSVTFNDEPYLAADIEKVSYMLYDANNQVVAKGEVEPITDGQYQIVLAGDATSKLEAGGSKLSVAVSSKLVSIPAFAVYQFVVNK